ncbi:unnamed protein product [Choristocarpus tenellus]
MGGSRTVSFSQDNMKDLSQVQEDLQQGGGVSSAAVVIPSWRQHVIQYDNLSAALWALKIPTVVSHLPDGLWAYALQRLQLNALRRASRRKLVQLTVIEALDPLFRHLDRAITAHSRSNPGHNVVIIASDDSAWLLQAFLNSRPPEWHKNVPVTAAVLVGNFHKSFVGDLALKVYPGPKEWRPSGKESGTWPGPVGVQFFSLNGHESGANSWMNDGGDDAIVDDDLSSPRSAISCVSLEEDIENCIIQEYDVGEGSGLSWLESTGLLGLWVPKVLRARSKGFV